MASRTIHLPGLLGRIRSESLARCADRELLERFVAVSDEAAFAAILDRHGPMLLGVCRRLLGDAHLADDVVQATFLVLARKARSIRRYDSLAGWLYGVAQRLARQARLAEAARSRRERRAAQGRGEVAAGDPAWDELLRVLDEELRRVPDRFRTPLLLCYLESRTQDEAAKQLGWSLSTLRRRLESGRELLRARLTRRGATLGAGLFAGFLAPSAARAVLRPELRQAVLAGATAGVRVPTQVLVLANGAMRMTNFAKISWCSALILVLGSALAGLAWSNGHATEASGPSPAARMDDRPAERRDRFSDSLPDGAVARLGTEAFRHGRAWHTVSLTFSLDGKYLVSAGGGWVRRWELAAGRADVNLGDGARGRSGGTELVTADGKTARLGMNVHLVPRGIEQQCTAYDLETGRARQQYRLEFPTDAAPHGLPVFLSPDGNTYAELNYYGTLTLWDAVAGKITHQVKPSGGQFVALAFAPDSKTAVVGDENYTFHIVDLATGKELRKFGTPNGSTVSRMAISPDGNWMVTAGGKKANNPAVWPHDRFIRLWDLRAGTVVHTLEFAEDLGAESLAFAPDSRTLLASLRGGNRRGATAALRTWDVASGKPGRAWTEDATIGLTLAVSPDGKTLATMNENGVIRLWDIATGAEKNARDASPCALEAVSFSADGKTVRTIGSDRAIRDWDAATGRPLGAVRVPAAKAFDPSFSSGDRPLLTGNFWGEDKVNRIRVIDPADGKLVLEQPGHWGRLSANGKRLALPDEKGRIRILDVAGGTTIRTLEPPADRVARASRRPLPQAFTADGESLIVVGETVSIWDVQTGERKSSWDLRERKVLEQPAGASDRQTWERIECIAVSEDGKLIAFALLKDLPDHHGPRDWFGRVMLLETATGKLLLQADSNESFATLAFSRDSKRLAGAGLWTVQVWDVPSGKSVYEFEGHRGMVKALAFSPDGTRLASASEDSTVLVWNVTR